MRAFNYPFLLILALYSLVSCNTGEKDEPAHFGIFTFNDQSSDKFAAVETLGPGKTSDVQNIGANESGVFTNKDGFYYGINDQTGDFIKFKVEGKSLKTVKRIPFKSVVTWRPVASWFSWANDTTLFLGSSMSGKKFVYAAMDVKNMKVTASGNLDIPAPASNFNYGGIMGRLLGDRLYVAYMLYQYEDKQALPGDTIYLATIDYPSMKTLNITRDTRSTFPGGYILFWQVSMEWDGDLYFIAQPGGRLRRHPKYKSAIYRIKKGDDKLDPDYFFPVSDNVTEEAYGLYDLGNGLAITKVVDKHKVNQFSDYYEAKVVDYYLLDLKNNTRTKMDLPVDRLDFHKNVTVKDGKVFVGVYQANDLSYIWSYDLKTKEIKKGLEVGGQILMLDALQ